MEGVYMNSAEHILKLPSKEKGEQESATSNENVQIKEV
jgi:hypothetical protein